MAGDAYRRDAVTWAAFGALFAFGFLNAILGPALPYIRASEGISYLVGALHQVDDVGGIANRSHRRPRVHARQEERKDGVPLGHAVTGARRRRTLDG